MVQQKRFHLFDSMSLNLIPFPSFCFVMFSFNLINYDIPNQLLFVYTGSKKSEEKNKIEGIEQKRIEMNEWSGIECNRMENKENK